MTKETAESLGIFTKWQTFPCQDCDIYTNLTDLEPFNALILCPKCIRKLTKHSAKQAQPQLFDDQSTLF